MPLAPLADFDAPVARAVVVVLRRAGVPARLAGEVPPGSADPELTVVVPEDRRDEALAAMAAAMEEIQAEVSRQAPAPTAPAGPDADDEDEDEDEEGGHRPLLFERLRRLGFLPVLLVPLLVVTLSQTRLPAAYAIALVVGGAAAVVAWRDGRRRRS